MKITWFLQSCDELNYLVSGRLTAWLVERRLEMVKYKNVSDSWSMRSWGGRAMARQHLSLIIPSEGGAGMLMMCLGSVQCCTTVRQSANWQRGAILSSDKPSPALAVKVYGGPELVKLTWLSEIMAGMWVLPLTGEIQSGVKQISSASHLPQCLPWWPLGATQF